MPDRDLRALSPLDWAALALFALALFLIPFVGGNFATPQASGDLGLPVLLGLVSAGCLLAILREWKQPVAIGGIPALGGLVLLFGVGATASLAVSPARYLTVNALAALFACLILAGWVSRLARDRVALQVLLLVPVVAATLIGLLGVWEYVVQFQQGFTTHRVFAGFANPNFLAGYLLLVLPVTLSVFVAAQHRVWRGLGGGCLALQTACLLLTGSRTGVLVLAGALVLWLGLLAAIRISRTHWIRVGTGIGILVVAALLASAPTRARLATANSAPSSSSASAGVRVSTDQSHSGEFRRYTWTGTVRMAMAHRWLGVGLGTFEVTYPRYAETAFTAHAHNSYLQLMAEVGIPAAALLICALAAASAFAARVLLLPQPQTQETRSDFPRGLSDTHLPNTFFAPDAGKILLAGLLATLAATLARSLLDSDWYVLAIAATLSAQMGLMVAQARDLAPLATHTPRPLASLVMAGGVTLALLLALRASMVVRSRTSLAAVQTATSTTEAVNLSRAAAIADPLDPEPHLQAALILTREGDAQAAEQELQEATRLASMGRAYYRLGQFYKQQNQFDRAIEAFRAARVREPRNVQNLRQLAETLQAAGRVDEAVATLQQLTALEQTPYGRVRAIPEVPEMEFARAHVLLGDIALKRNDLRTADAEYALAAAQLREYWPKRRDIMVQQIITPQKRTELADLYEHLLTQWQTVCRDPNINRPDQARTLAEELLTVRNDRSNDASLETNTSHVAVP